MSFDIPDACTLPTVDRPLRLAEFDDLFATALRDVEILAPTHAGMRLSATVGLAERVRDLAARETECCSFFDIRAPNSSVSRPRRCHGCRGPVG
jgi:hypothetical protein